MGIEVKNITKQFGSFYALNDVSLCIQSGELFALLGPSGSGKTTLLRIIAGLEEPSGSSGEILFAGENVEAQRVGDRGVGFVFQHYALFRHMTVFDNIAFGLRIRPRRSRPGKAVIREKVMELLHLIQLDNLADRYPHQLSGGQRQRVALARALAVEPKVLLLDEPFGALDAKVRQELRSWLRRLHDEVHLTSVFVTHDQDEALELADRVAVMNAGRIEQVGTPDEVFHNPATEFVMHFLGSVNQFHGRLEKGKLQIGTYEYEYDWDAFSSVKIEDDLASIFVRPHDLALSLFPEDGSSSIRANVVKIHSAGARVRVEMQTAETQDVLVAEISHQEYRDLHLEHGENIFVTPRNLRVFGSSSLTNSDSQSFRPRKAK
ncbi:MAG: sulfate ABC transporter ATP-binding protein [Planctomycetaceae bacterium]|nr:sulfate ABC transporter ATP-binding protein [Planctomycetaceae bacterium]